MGGGLCDAALGVRTPAGWGCWGRVRNGATSSSRHYSWLGPCSPALGAELEARGVQFPQLVDRVVRLGGGTKRKRHGLFAHVVGPFLFWLAGRPLG